MLEENKTHLLEINEQSNGKRGKKQLLKESNDEELDSMRPNPKK